MARKGSWSAQTQDVIAPQDRDAHRRFQTLLGNQFGSLAPELAPNFSLLSGLFPHR